MKNLIIKGLIATGALWFFCTGTGYAQFPQFGGAKAMQMFAPFASGFSAESAIEIRGEIQRMINVRGRMIPTIAAIIQDDDEKKYEVRLGPMWFIQSMRDFSFRKGTKILVFGSPIEEKDGVQVITALRITIDGKETVLRDEMGIPVWAPISKKKSGMSFPSMMGGGGMMGGGMKGGGMMGGSKNGAGRGDSRKHDMKNFPGKTNQEIHMSGEGDADEDAEDMQGGKIPGGYQ